MTRPWWSELRWQIGEALARFPWVLRYDGPAPRGGRYINRINGHCVVRSDASTQPLRMSGYDPEDPR